MHTMSNIPFRITVSPNTATINLKSAIINYSQGMIKDIEPVVIVQIGAGGTGSYVVPEVMRYIGSLPERIKEKIFYVIMDGDNVELKNIDRQNFIEEDVGKNKAIAMLDAYASYYGVLPNNVKAVPKYLTEASDLYKVMEFDAPCFEYTIKPLAAGTYNSNVSYGYSEPKPHVIVIDCVDKTTPRSIINDWMNCHYAEKYNNSIKDIYLVSSGNGKFSGQVGIGRYVYKCWSNYGTDGIEAIEVLKEELSNKCMEFNFSLENPSNWDKVTSIVLKSIGRKVKMNTYGVPYVGQGAWAILNTDVGRKTTITSITVNATRDDVGSIQSIVQEQNRCTITPERLLSCVINTKLPYDRYPELIDVNIDKEEEQLSCADRAQQNVQSIQANKTASNIVCNYVLNILSCMYPMDNSKHNGIRFHTVAFDAEENSFTSYGYSVKDMVE